MPATLSMPRLVCVLVRRPIGDRSPIQLRDYGSGPLDRTGPDPDLVVVGWDSELDQDGAFCPGNRVALHQLLDTVLPQHPGLHPLWDGGGAHCLRPHLLRQQAPGLTLGEAWTFGHAQEYRTTVLCRLAWIRCACGDPSMPDAQALSEVVRAG